MEKVPPNVRKDMYVGLAIADKYRPGPNAAEVNEVVGDVNGKTVYLVDDIWDTGGTIRASSRAYRQKGAAGIKVVICHPVLSPGQDGKAGAKENLEEILREGLVDEVILGNTNPVKDFAIVHPNVRIMPIEPFVADAIRRIHWNRSVSGIHEYRDIVRAYQNGADIYQANPKMVRIENRGK